MPRIILPVYQNHEADGSVASAATLHFYENESDPPLYKSIFLDPEMETDADNPFTLDDNGYTPDLYGVGAYTIVAKDQFGTQMWHRDNVVISASGNQFADWSPITVYGESAIVRAEDGEYYQSLISGNIGNNPYASSEQWSRIAFLKYWNEDETYAIGENVVHMGIIWTSTENDNLGNEPTEEAEEWNTSFSGFVNPMTTVGDLIIATTDGEAIRLPIGTSGHVLKSNGTTAAWAEETGGGGGGTDANYVDLGSVAVSGSESVNLDLTGADLLGANVYRMSLESSNTTGALTLTITNEPATPYCIHIAIQRPGRKSGGIVLPTGWVYNQSQTPSYSSTAGTFCVLSVTRFTFFSSTAAVVTMITQMATP